ncbi:MAG: SET domain-containing protein-lysine N-methyltransferase [Pseudomonadota bacterium]
MRNGTSAGAVATNDGVEIRIAGDRGRGVFTTRAFAAGEIVVRGRPVGWVRERDNRSLQMGPDRHALFDEPACLINHSCGPITGVRDNPVGGYDFIALADIPAQTEVTFDYATTEYVSVAVPVCLCGAVNCRGASGGFTTLPSDHPLIGAGFIAGYLRGEPRRAGAQDARAGAA